MSSIYIKNVNIINPFSEEPLEERHVLIENVAELSHCIQRNLPFTKTILL